MFTHKELEQLYSLTNHKDYKNLHEKINKLLGYSFEKKIDKLPDISNFPEPTKRISLHNQPTDARQLVDCNTHLSIYVDGSSYPNPGPGGFSVVVYATNDMSEPLYVEYGSFKKTTNNRMELHAAYIAHMIQLSYKDSIIYSDSKYAIGTITGAYNGSANRDMINHYRKYVKTKYLKIKWVKGHSGNIGNEYADSIAEAARLLPTDIIDIKYN